MRVASYPLPVHPKSSQIGVHLTHMGTDWRRVQRLSILGNYPILAILGNLDCTSPRHFAALIENKGGTQIHPCVALG
jgi:hypothetical protein